MDTKLRDVQSRSLNGDILKIRDHSINEKVHLTVLKSIATI